MPKQLPQYSLTILIFCYLLSVNLYSQQPAITLDFPAVNNHLSKSIHMYYIIEGGWEQRGVDGNWGIVAFPYLNSKNIPQNHTYAPIGITDFNDIDRYRILYLWRTYVIGDQLTYKFILK